MTAEPGNLDPEPLGRRGRMVVRRTLDAAGVFLGTRHWFWCPGCSDIHGFVTGDGPGPRWTRSGPDDAPTFAPSLRVSYTDPVTGQSVTMCHLYLQAGQLQFLDDSAHALAGQTAPLPEPPNWL